MEYKDGRSLIEGQRVSVYRNLNKNCFSIYDNKTGLVVAYAQNVLLEKCLFVIRKAGQKKAKESKVRNVHAFVVGHFVGADVEQPKELNTKVRYHPFELDYFVKEDTNEEVKDASFVFLSDKRAYIR